MSNATGKVAEISFVYNNRTSNFVDWCQEAQRCFKALGLDRFDEVNLAPKHAYELGYTPDSWAREVQDQTARAKRVREFKKFNP
jgi:hypothetical protein